MFRLEFVSNQGFTDTEFTRWVAEVLTFFCGHIFWYYTLGILAHPLILYTLLGYSNILLCLTQDDFICQGESDATSLLKFFTQFILNCEQSSRTDLFRQSQFKRNQVKYIDEEIFLCKWKSPSKFSFVKTINIMIFVSLFGRCN